VDEGLEDVVRQVKSKGFLEGTRVGKKEVYVSMLQFTNDTIFVCKDDVKNILVIKIILRCYQLTSKLKVNFHKSKLRNIGVHQKSIDRCAPIQSFTYLEVKLELVIEEKIYDKTWYLE